MTTLQRSIVALGVLDLAYVAQVAFGMLTGAGISNEWQGILAFGLPYPTLQAAVIIGIYIAIFACGLGLVFRRPSFVWLNYTLLPVRVILALPTLFPVFAILTSAGITIHFGLVFALLVATELGRVILVRTWAGKALATDRVAGAAA